VCKKDTLCKKLFFNNKEKFKKFNIVFLEEKSYFLVKKTKHKQHLSSPIFPPISSLVLQKDINSRAEHNIPHKLH